MRSSRDLSSPLVGKSPARPRTSGTIPIPIVSDPTAQLPSTRMRCFQYCVTSYHGWLTWEAIALMRISEPARSTKKPSQSPFDHVARRARPHSLDQIANSTAKIAAIGMTISSPRTAGASSDAATPAITQPRERCTSAFAINSSASAAYGYANVSSTIQDEYASEGMVAAPVAAKIAHHFGSSIRARKYVGKMTDVMAKTSTYLIAEYAEATSSIHHSGAVNTG